MYNDFSYTPFLPLLPIYTHVLIPMVFYQYVISMPNTLNISSPRPKYQCLIVSRMNHRAFIKLYNKILAPKYKYIAIYYILPQYTLLHVLYNYICTQYRGSVNSVYIHKPTLYTYHPLIYSCVHIYTYTIVL